MRTGDDDADGMKQFFPLRPGFGLHFVDDGLESLGRDGSLYGFDFFRECCDDFRSLFCGQDFGVVRRGLGSSGVIFEDHRRALRQVFQLID